MTEIEKLAAAIADRMFCNARDRDQRDDLEKLLLEFAAEIKRGAIEP